MRLRTGHGPNDWTDNIPGCHAAVGGHGGQLVVAPSAPATHKAIGRRIVPVDLNDYHKAHRWDGKPRCGVFMPIAKEPCARMPGHKAGEHRTAFAIQADLERRRRAVA